MARKKMHLDRDKLVNAIQQVEDADDAPDSLSNLYKRVADIMDVPLGVVIGRIKDYEISLKTPMGKKGRPCRTVEAKPTLDFTPFEKRGIIVNSLGDLLTSSLRDEDENNKRRLAWYEIRQSEGLPAPPKE